MAVAAGVNAQVLLDEFNMHQFARSFQVQPQIDIHDASVLGTTSRVKVSGIKHAMASGEFFVDDTAVLGSYLVLKGKYDGGAGILTFAPQGFAIGRRTMQMYAHESTFEINAVVDDLEKINFQAESANDGVDLGVSLHALTAEIASTDSASVDNTLSSANGGVGVLHVTAVSGGSPSATIKIQHSTNNTVWVDLISFTAATTVTKQRVEVTGTVNRYLRASSTITGTTPSFLYNASFARR